MCAAFHLMFLWLVSMFLAQQIGKLFHRIKPKFNVKFVSIYSFNLQILKNSQLIEKCIEASKRRICNVAINI